MVDKKSSPAFSIGHSTSSNKSPSHLFPGPGAYDPPSTLKNSKISTGVKSSQPRFRQQPNSIPGPGTYSSPASKDHVPTALILSRTKEEKPEVVPGPGAYEPNYRKVVKSDSGFTMGHSQKIQDIVGLAKKLPGPGNYEVNFSTVSKDHAAKIGTEKRSTMVLNDFTPGPGQYKEGKPQDLMKNAPKIIFGKSGRSLSTNNINPGPGSYTYHDKFQQSINKSKGFSMSFKHPEKTAVSQKQPGPGAYNTEEIDKLRNKILSFSLGKQARLKVANEKEILSHPGPERYNYKFSTFDGKSSLFGKQKRANMANQANIPGPGAYHAKLDANLPQFSIPKSNSHFIKSSTTPGPGSYEPKMNLINEYNSIKLPKDERKAFYNEKKGIPGPGTYNQDIPQKQHGFKIGNEKRSDNRNQNIPAPGHYNIPSTISNLPKYSH